MSDTVQVADQYLLGSSLKSDPAGHVSKNKRSVYVSDLNQGSYTSGLVTVDATNQLNGAQGFGALREAYLTVPYVITAKNTHGSTALAGRLSRFACTLKTNVANVISDLEVELNGKQILTTNEYKNFWNNLRCMTENSTSDMYKHGSDMFLQPDDWFSINFDANPSPHGDGYSNNSVDIAQTLDTTLGQTQEHRAFNRGLFDRLCSSTPMIVDTTTNNAYSWASLGKDGIKQIAAQAGRGGFLEVASSAAAGAIAGTWVFMLKIRLVDLHPLFKELDLVANPQIKLRYRVNSGQVDITGGASNAMALTASTITSGNTCPIMVASAATGCPMNGVIASGGKLSFAFGALQNAFTTTSMIADILPYTTTRLHIPFYDLEDARSIVSKPVKTVRYLDCFAQYFKGRAGSGVISGQQNAAFNFQLSASLKNVKYVALIPFADTTSGYWSTAGVVAEQFQSPFDSAPYTCQPGAVVRNFQVQIGNVNSFAKTHEYDYESFLNEFCKISSINGDIDRTMNTGLVDIDRWAFAQRILIADVSRLTERDVPTAIQVSGTNSCSQSSNYLVLCVYERMMEIDRLTGEVSRSD